MVITNVASSTAGLEWLGTVRGRFGFAADRALFYVTGGLAYGEAKASSTAVNFDGSNTDVFAGSLSKTRTGYTSGGGLEYVPSPTMSPSRASTSITIWEPRVMPCSRPNSVCRRRRNCDRGVAEIRRSIARAGIQTTKFGGPVVARY